MARINIVNPLVRSVLLCFFVLIYSGCDEIINVMAFHPDTKNVLSVDRLPSGVEEQFISSGDNFKIQSYYLPFKDSDRLLIYFHGNAGNIGHRVYDLMKIRSMGVNVLGISYRGYGKSDGKPSEDGIYADARAALKYSEKQLGFSLDKIIIMGRSIGTTAAVQTAQQLKLAGLILISPLTSGKAQAKTTNLSPLAFLAGDAFNNISKIKNIICPVLIIHGTNDKIIPFRMGEEIYNGLQTKKELVKIEGAGHNDLSIEYYELYWASVKKFLKDQPKN